MMQKKQIYCLLTILTICLVGCKDDVADAGASLLKNEDNISVKADTFSVHSQLGTCDPISMTPDSFLLGECDTHFGTIKADILTQLACPQGFQYPSANTAQVDSVCLFLYYNSWYGDGNTPLSITVYEMDKTTLNYNERYPSDTALASFCSLNDSTRITLLSRIIVANRPTDSIYSSSLSKYVPYIRLKLSDKFAQRFFRIQDFSSQEQFNQQFKGLYITTDFGAATVLYVTDINMAVYYHFTYPQSNSGNDTILTDVKAFYANSEVRQINRYQYPRREQVIQQLSLITDTNYVVAPANICTKLSVRMDSVFLRMEEQLGDPEGYRVYVNKADLTIDVIYQNDNNSTRPRDTWDKPATYMMLVKESNYDTFFAKNELPNDTSAIVATLSSQTDTTGNVSYFYSYDLSTLLTNQLRATQRDDILNFVLVPVSVETSNSTSTITSVKQLQTISATRIRSAANTSQPMDIEVVYSGFNKTRR